MRAYLIDVANNDAKVVDIQDSLETYYSLINCECIDIVTRTIGGKEFDIVCDDVGRLVDNPIPSMYSSKGEVMFCGNIVICGVADNNGCLTSLTDKDIELISRYIISSRVVLWLPIRFS